MLSFCTGVCCVKRLHALQPPSYKLSLNRIKWELFQFFFQLPSEQTGTQHGN